MMPTKTQVAEIDAKIAETRKTIERVKRIEQLKKGRR